MTAMQKKIKQGIMPAHGIGLQIKNIVHTVLSSKHISMSMLHIPLIKNIIFIIELQSDTVTTFSTSDSTFCSDRIAVQLTFQ